MSNEKTVTTQSTTEKQTPVVDKTTTTTVKTETKPDPKPRVVEETVTVEED